MTRLDRQSASLLYLTIALMLGAVFAADLMTRLGIAVWVFYLLPLGLCLFAPMPLLPLPVAVAASVLMVIGFFASPPGMDPGIARTNRVIGAVVLWAVAALAYWFVTARLKVQRLTWLQSGQTLLAQRLMGELTPQQVAARAVAALVEHTGAQVAALYALEDGRLRRMAGWADGGDEVPGAEVLRPGEGLAGQAARESRVLALRDAASDHLALSSALGRSLPTQVLAAPLTAGGRAVAVIELGFLGDGLDLDRRIELLERVAEKAGVALRSAEYRQRLQQLLEETQRQAEELQVQQEELRTSNEELEEQGRALRESQSRLENQQAELEQTNEQLEEQTRQLERHRDDLLMAQRTLAANAEELERASRYKSEFLANMSHELRTPLNSSLILAKLLAENREANLSPEQVRYAQTIHASNQDLLALINDILDLSKIEAGRIEIVPEPVAMAQVLEPLRRAFEPQAAQKGLALRLEAAPDAPAAVDTDPQRLQQVLRNLLSNAIKFTESGEVSLTVRPADAGQVAFAVHDTGIGIPPAQQEVIFEAFRQADGTTSRKYGGTGLGLSISRELARLLGGRITVASEPGRGSTFTLTLPRKAPRSTSIDPDPGAWPSTNTERFDAARAAAELAAAQARIAQAAHATPAPAPAPPAPVPAPAPAETPATIPDDRAHRTRPGRLILVIEDDPAFAGVLYDLAHEMDFDCVHAATAAEGLELARELRPGAILLDMGLPDRSGLSVLERLKSDPATRHVPVHVLSGTDYAQTALEMGAVGYALKPVAREQIAQVIGQLESHLERRLRSVLVIEDDAALRDGIQALLDAPDVEIVTVGTVAASLEQLAARSFDCVVMDLALPDGSGYELLEKMAAGDRYAFPPVIVYTGRALTREEETQLRRYSRSIIIKGAKSPERLIDEVSLFLHRVESDLPPEQQRLLRQARARDAAFDGRRLLLVEDDVRNIFALSSVLEPLGAKMLVARNGREALDVLAREPEVDLVLMDLMMPEMDGLEATRRIRQQPRLERLPIIALTAKAMPEDRDRCLAAGANDYIAKPLDIDRLLSLCRVWLPK